MNIVRRRFLASAFVTLSFSLVIALSVSLGALRPTPAIFPPVYAFLCEFRACPTGAIAMNTDAYQTTMQEIQSRDSGEIYFGEAKMGYWHSAPEIASMLIQEPYPDATLAELGDLLAYFGDPCSIAVTDFGTWLLYPTLNARLGWENGYLITSLDMRLTPTTEIMTLTDGDDCDLPPGYGTSGDLIVPWRGLNSLRLFEPE